MSDTKLSDCQLLHEAKKAFRKKDTERAKHLAAEIEERSLAKNKAKVANDVT